MPVRAPHQHGTTSFTAARDPTPLADDALVARIAEGDEQAFEQLFTRHYAPLCDLARSYVHSPEIAEDLVQTVLLRVWEHRRTWEPHGTVRAYLFAACRNAALDCLRHARIERSLARRPFGVDDPPGLGRTPPLPDEAAAARELTQSLRRAVDALPERRRAVVILRWQYQLGPTEIARVLGISVKGVEAHFARAFAALRELLSAVHS